jgi:hypothetical protein
MPTFHAEYWRASPEDQHTHCPPPASTPAPPSMAPISSNATSGDTDRAQEVLQKEIPPQGAEPSDARPPDASAQEAGPLDALPSASTAMDPLERAEPSVGGATPGPVQAEAAKSQPPEGAAKHLPPETAGERFAPALATKTPDFPPALSVFATLAAAPPKLGSAYADPTQDLSASVEPSRPAPGPVPLPKSKPRVAAKVGVARSAAWAPHVPVSTHVPVTPNVPVAPNANAANISRVWRTDDVRAEGW